MTSLLEPNPAVLGLFHGFPDWGQVIATEETRHRAPRRHPRDGRRRHDQDRHPGRRVDGLQHATSRLKTTLVIQTEVEFLPMYVGQPLFSEVEMFLRSQGFMLHRFFPTVSRVMRPLLVENNIYAGLSQVAWADAIFVRDFTQLAVLGDQQLLKAGAIHPDIAAMDPTISRSTFLPKHATHGR